MEIALIISFWSGLSLIVTVESQLTEIAQTLMKAVTEPTQFCFFEVLKLSSDIDLGDRLTNFWHPDLPITEDMGCVIRCGMQRIELLDSEDHVNQKNLETLLTAHGAETNGTIKFIEMVADCRHKSKAVGCEMAAIMAECIRFQLYSWNWLPPYQEWAEEAGGDSFAPDKQESVGGDTGGDSLVPDKQKSVEKETGGDSLIPDKQESVEKETDEDSFVPDKQESGEEEKGGDSFVPDKQESAEKETGGDNLVSDKQESVEEEKGGDGFVPDKKESIEEETGKNSFVPDKQESVEEETGKDSFVPDKQESVEEEKGGDSFVPDKQDSVGEDTGGDRLVPDKQESVEEETDGVS